MDETAPLPDDPGAYTYPTMGDAGSAPTATVYGNFKCPYTRELVLGNLDDIVAEFVETGRLAIQFYDLAYQPGDTSTAYITGSDPRIAAFALGVWDEDPDGYWRFYAETFRDQPQGDVSYDELASRAETAGISNVDAVVERVRAGTYDGAVEQVAAAAADDGITFTPTLELAGETTAPHHGTQAILDWIDARVDDAPSGTDDGDESTESGEDESAESGDDTDGDADGGADDEPTSDESDGDESDAEGDDGTESDGDGSADSSGDTGETGGTEPVESGEDEFEWVSDPEDPASTGDTCS